MSGDSYHPQPSGRSTATPWRGVLAALAVLAAASGAPVAGSPVKSGGAPRDHQFLQFDASSRAGADLNLVPRDESLLEGESGAERFFRGDLVAARAVATFSRGTRPIKPTNQRLDVFDAAVASPTAPEANSVTGAELSETIFALQSDSSASRSGPPDAPDDSVFAHTSATRSPRKARQMFWEESADGDILYGDAGVDAAVASAGARSASASLVIPLPAAAWSGLSVMFGVGVLAGARRLRHRLGW